MVGKSPQTSHEPHSKPKGLSELTQARSERERGAQGWGKPWSQTTKVPRHPRTIREREKIHKKYLSSEKVCDLHNSTEGSVNIELICITGPSAKRLDEVIR